MNREELIDKMVAAIEKMKEETNKGVIKDYEKKYKEALEVAKRKLCFDKAGMVDSFTPNDIYEMFPELKDSEDERTWIINYLSNRILNSTIIAEKENLKKAVAWLEKQGEQKPTDKVEPKFKVGDWIANNVYNNVVKVLEVNEQYRLDYGNTIGAVGVELIDTDYHLWTIKDAKDGDVLTASDGSIFLFAGVVDLYCKYYVALTTDGAFKYNEGLEYYWETSTAVHPAPKEQRDLLFQKMHEAGYEWDAEKKELKKIEQMPAEIEKLAKGNERENPISVCSEEDEKMLSDIVKDLVHPWNEYIPDRIEDEIKWLKSLKGRVQPKKEWSEQDNKNLKECVIAISMSEGHTLEEKEQLENWLKSLKERYTWKPSDLPHWQKSTLPNDNTTGFNSDYFCHKGYNINYKELFEKLPKDD